MTAKKMGRPMEHAEPMKSYSLILAPQHVATIRALGENNLSAGVRLAIEIAAKHMPEETT
jgi:hypothetical protein